MAGVRRKVVGAGMVAVVVLASCSGSESPPTVVTAPAPDTSAAASAFESPDTTAAPIPQGIPGVAALISGRGDDGSLEVGIWFGSNPFTAASTRIRVGTDSDDSYPGVGDPVPHMDGWLDIDSDGMALIDGGTLVADSTTGGLDTLVSWTGPGETQWVYFIGTVPVRAGTVWVVVEVDGSTPVGGVAGAPLGAPCSYHAAGIDLGAVPGDTPNPGTPCRYPTG
jgi:hypothetical protein